MDLQDGTGMVIQDEYGMNGLKLQTNRWLKVDGTTAQLLRAMTSFDAVTVVLVWMAGNPRIIHSKAGPIHPHWVYAHTAK